jgi:alkylation response protein AidB-like acyl-CoA dehydrogenase
MNHLAKPLAAETLPTAPTGEDLIAKAWELAPSFKTHAADNEKLGRLTDEVIDTLLEHGFMGSWVPKEYGGSECWPVEGLQIIEALSYGDGSTGWALMALEVGTASAAAYLPKPTSQKIFGAGIPLIAGQGAPVGKAEKVDGGYILNGDFRYGSGILHCQYFHSGGIVHENGKPAMMPGTDMPEGRIFITPIEDGELLENWDVMGLRATGSVDYKITDLFVPDENTHLIVAKRANTGGDLYRITIPGMGSYCHGGFALGIGRRVLDELREIAQMNPSRSAMISPAGGNDSFHEQFAHNEAKFRAARAFIVEAQQRLTDTVKRGEDPSVRDVTLTRLALNHVTSVVAEVCQFAYYFSGGVGLRDSTIQRCLRDMYAGTQHASTAPAVLRECAKDLLGFAEGKMWAPRNIVDPFPFEEFRN